jgi:hypothetical protein
MMDEQIVNEDQEHNDEILVCIRNFSDDGAAGGPR